MFSDTQKQEKVNFKEEASFLKAEAIDTLQFYNIICGYYLRVNVYFLINSEIVYNSDNDLTNFSCTAFLCGHVAIRK